MHHKKLVSTISRSFCAMPDATRLTPKTQAFAKSKINWALFRFESVVGSFSFRQFNIYIYIYYFKGTKNLEALAYRMQVQYQGAAITDNAYIWYSGIIMTAWLFATMQYIDRFGWVESVTIPSLTKSLPEIGAPTAW